MLMNVTSGELISLTQKVVKRICVISLTVSQLLEIFFMKPTINYLKTQINTQTGQQLFKTVCQLSHLKHVTNMTSHSLPNIRDFNVYSRFFCNVKMWSFSLILLFFQIFWWKNLLKRKNLTLKEIEFVKFYSAKENVRLKDLKLFAVGWD